MGADIIKDKYRKLLHCFEHLILRASPVEGRLEAEEQVPEVHKAATDAAFEGEVTGEGSHEEGLPHSVVTGKKNSPARWVGTARPGEDPGGSST